LIKKVYVYLVLFATLMMTIGGSRKFVMELIPDTMRVVFKDNGFKNDAAKTNVKENLRQAGIDEFVTV